MLGSKYKSKEKYEKLIKQAWSRVDQTTINKLVAKHKEQLQKIKKANGSWVNY